MARLAPQYNWRPYLHWPSHTVPPGARLRILHFHGPKPHDIISFFVLPKIWNGGEINGQYKGLLESNPKAYLRALADWLKLA